jgi:hypothetical protein
MPGYQFTLTLWDLLTGPSDPSSNNDGDSTNSTGSSDIFTRRSDAPGKPTLAELVFAAYQEQKNAEVRNLQPNVFASLENAQGFAAFDASYGMWEEDLKAEAGGGLGQYGIEVVRLYKALRSVTDFDDRWPNDDWCKDDHVALLRFVEAEFPLYARE